MDDPHFLVENYKCWDVEKNLWTFSDFQFFVMLGFEVFHRVDLHLEISDCFSEFIIRDDECKLIIIIIIIIIMKTLFSFLTYNCKSH